MRRRTRPAVSLSASFAAPVRGLIENENLAMNGGNGCSVLDNWFPLQATVRLRGGAFKVADVGSAPILKLIPYQVGPTVGLGPKFFAATATNVYDITSLNPETTPTSVVSGASSGRWSFVQFGTAGGSFLVMVNGTNFARLYNGTTWTTINASSTPAITGVATNVLSHVWVHGRRLWAVEKNTMNAWYLPVNSIAGVMTQFAMGGVFKKGGSLLFGTVWSSDSGAGMDDRCLFVTDQGEVAVYEGVDPSDLATWRIVGRYEMAPPVSAETISSGGDVLFATTDGVVPISQVTNKDPSQLSLAAITRPVEPTWLRAVRTRDPAIPFSMAKWDAGSMGIFGFPHRNETLVVNMQTAAWAKYTGWDVQALGLFNGQAYFADGLGNVYQAEGGGSDNGAIYVARLQTLPNHLGAPGFRKVTTQARASFRALAPFTARLSVAIDYDRNFPNPPSAALDATTPALWDVGQWDVSRWDDGPDAEERLPVSTRWRSTPGSGFSHSAQLQVTCGGTRKPDAELVAIDLMYQRGAMVV